MIKANEFYFHNIELYLIFLYNIVIFVYSVTIFGVCQVGILKEEMT